jgi:hypothetical protein
MTERDDPTTVQPERFNRAVRAACCPSCSYPACGCQMPVKLIREAIIDWEKPYRDCESEAKK